MRKYIIFILIILTGALKAQLPSYTHNSNVTINGQLNTGEITTYRLDIDTNYNVFAGFNVAPNAPTGQFNVFVGRNSGSLLTSGNNNTSMGYNSLSTITIGQYNTSIGYHSGRYLTNGLGNLFVGTQAGMETIGGYYNTFVGTSSGQNNTTGEYNIFLGTNSGYNAVDLDNRFIINSLNRTNILGDTTLSIIYGYQDATTPLQRLYLNANTFISDDLTVEEIVRIGNVSGGYYTSIGELQSDIRMLINSTPRFIISPELTNYLYLWDSDNSINSTNRHTEWKNQGSVIAYLNGNGSINSKEFYANGTDTYFGNGIVQGVYSGSGNYGGVLGTTSSPLGWGLRAETFNTTGATGLVVSTEYLGTGRSAVFRNGLDTLLTIDSLETKISTNLSVEDAVYTEGLSVGGSATVDSIVSLDYAIENETSIDSIPIRSHKIKYNESEGTFEFSMGKSDVIWQGALEDLAQVYNITGSLITNGTPLAFAGQVGDSIIAVIPATCAIDSISKRFAGIATSDIPVAGWGYAATRGFIRGLNTSAFSNLALYLGNYELIDTIPPYPNNAIVAAGLIKIDATEGIIAVNISRVNIRALASKSYSFTSQGIGAGTYYKAGFYRAPTTSTTLTQASPTVTYGTANALYDAHGWVVCGGAGTVDAGVIGLEIEGTSITDAGVETVGDKDTIITDITSVALDEYYEAKKFIGTITIRLITISGSPATYSLILNYGLAKYEDLGNRDFYITGCNIEGLPAATDASFDVELLHHKATGWTYAASGFAPGDGAITSISSTHPSYTVVNGEEFAWKRTGLNQFIDGNGSEGLILRITTGQNNTIQTMDLHVQIAIEQ